MIGSRADLERVKAALDADLFADPVRVGQFAITRAEARRVERELSVKFPAPKRVAQTATSAVNLPGLADAMPPADVARVFLLTNELMPPR